MNAARHGRRLRAQRWNWNSITAIGWRRFRRIRCGGWNLEHGRRWPLSIVCLLLRSVGHRKGRLSMCLSVSPIGGAIHGYVPQFGSALHVRKVRGSAVPLSVILGVPMYANAAGIVPVCGGVVSKVFPIGTALALMMAVGLSLPEATLLKKVMTWNDRHLSERLHSSSSSPDIF